MDICTTFLGTAGMMSDIVKCLLLMVFGSSSQQYEWALIPVFGIYLYCYSWIVSCYTGSTNRLYNTAVIFVIVIQLHQLICEVLQLCYDTYCILLFSTKKNLLNVNKLYCPVLFLQYSDFNDGTLTNAAVQQMLHCLEHATCWFQ